ncbi:Endonuclease/exonuclease/phosphatase [Cantharellus anzutake]|uniref:Endonuclease/exonuclease/phosphatase n=1 Tax=Cantharellus anzutake TaxID=1750568 RepID=UPI001903FCD8|nr:Endonuclease/exonuclease/phosphatase [Cantharellus anzutake]KAF8336902.1 Endonuclease/exonuclease/phosphatase [Cantharellus anzutake]
MSSQRESQLEDALRSSVRESEDILLWSQCSFAPSSVNTSHNWVDDVALAVVRHRSEGPSLFLYELSRSAPLIVRLIDIFPVTPKLTITSKRATVARDARLGMNDGILGTTLEYVQVDVRATSRSAVCLISHHVSGMEAIVNEVEWLRVTDSSFPHNDSGHWLAHYSASISNLHDIPGRLHNYRTYLRSVPPPLVLSDAGAGFVSDEDSDIMQIREAWIREQALLYSVTTEREDTWYTAILEGLGEDLAQKYSKVFTLAVGGLLGSFALKLASRQLVGMLIIVLIHESLQSSLAVGSVSSASAGAGLLGTMGNKGAVAIRFTLDDTALCFVNSHLAAGDEMTLRRNNDYHELCRRLQFPLETQSSSTLDDCDILFWLVGWYVRFPMFFPPSMPILCANQDLNYRINLPDHEVRVLIGDAPLTGYQDLLSFDQFNQQRGEGSVFTGYSEQSISFPPTVRGHTSSIYDSKRTPAWTDRILVKGSPRIVTPISYTSYPEIPISDHKPVAAEYLVTLRTLQWEEFDKTITRFLDFINAEPFDEIAALGLTVLNSEIDFGVVRYDRPSQREIAVRNDRNVVVFFRFLPLKQNEGIVSTWLSLEPSHGLVAPGAQINILCTARISGSVASRFNPPRLLSDLEATLVLHAARGRDAFVSVKGTFARTCIGTDLAVLSRLTVPVREFSADSDLGSASDSLAAPPQILKLINWLMTEALDVDDLFLRAPDADSKLRILELLDIGKDLPTFQGSDGQFGHSEPFGGKLAMTSHAVASCLVGLIEYSPTPLIPYELYGRCALIDSREGAFEIVDLLPPVSANAVISLTAYLHLYLQHHSNLSRKKIVLASVFGSLFFPDPPEHRMLMTPLMKRRFILQFLD